MSRPMTDEEIRREYRLAKHPAKQINILAQENSCTPREIRDILRAGGLAVPGRPPSRPGTEDGIAPHQPPAATASPRGKPGNAGTPAAAEDLSGPAGHLPFQGRQETENEEPPSWPVLPSAPPLAGDFPEDSAAETAERKEDSLELKNFVPIQDLAEGLVSPPGTEPAAAGTEERIATAPAGPHPAGEGSPLGTPALPRNDGAGEEMAAPRPYSPESGAAPQAAPLEHSGETSFSGRVVSPRPENGGTPAEAEEGGNIYRISGKDLSRMWHILGRLQGVLEASAEAGRPGEVMKDACDELEVILCGIQQDAG